MHATRLTLPLATVLLSMLPGLAHAVTIDWVTVGDPSNAADGTGYGAVAEEFRIGKYEITIGQYAGFLNAVAKSDPYSLYNPSMESNLHIRGISRSGSDGSYEYNVTGPSGIAPEGASSPGNRPITYVSWFDAARFANWMHNGQLTGSAGAASTETGAYTLVGGQTSGTAPAKNPAAQFYLPTENQWYKAAYYKGGGLDAGYWDYATQSDADPGNTIGSTANQANYYAGDYAVTQSSSYSSSQNYLTDRGAFTNSVSAYGTFDQSGNVYEWNDLTGEPGSARGLRGGYWDGGAFDLSSSNRATSATFDEESIVGFRLASPVPVPEPSIRVIGMAVLACGGYSMFRRRKRTGAARLRGRGTVPQRAVRADGVVDLPPANTHPPDPSTNVFPRPTAAAARSYRQWPRLLVVCTGRSSDFASPWQRYPPRWVCPSTTAASAQEGLLCFWK